MSILEGLQNAPPSQPGRIDFRGIAQGRNQQFMNMYSQKLLDQAFNANKLTIGANSVSYEGASGNFPTLEEAWNDYRSNAENRAIRPDYAAFKQLYDAVNQEYNNFMVSQLSGLAMSNVSLKTIKDKVKADPDFRRHLTKLATTNPEIAAQIAQYMPNKPLAQMIAENPNWYTGVAGGIGIGGIIGAKYLSTVPADSLQAARDLVRSRTPDIAKLRGNLQTARGLLAEAVKSGDKDAIKAAEELLADEKKPYQAARGSQKQAADQLKKTRWNKMFGEGSKFGKWGTAGKLGAWTFAPMLAEAGTNMLTDHEGVSKGAGLATSTAISGTMLGSNVKSIANYVKKKGNSNFMKLAAKKLGRNKTTMLASRGLFAGIPVVGTLLSAGLLAYDIYKLAQWANEDLGLSEKAKIGSGQTDLRQL